MNERVGLDDDWNTIEHKLPANWRELASEHGVLIHEGRAGKDGSGWQLRDAAVLLRMILHYCCTQSSLRITTALAAALGLADISGVALHKWMRKTGAWLAAMVSEMLSTAAHFAPERWAGYEVIAADASTVEMPGATGTTARVHFALRLFDLCSFGILVTGPEIGETLRNFVLKARQLWIADRGYCNANSIAHAAVAKAAVLIRFAFGPLPLFDALGAALDPRVLVRKLVKPGQLGEWHVRVHPKGKPEVEGRLIAVRLPPESAEKARRRLYEEHKRSKVSASMLELAQYVVLFTTVPSSRLGAEQLIELYRLRWQVELAFKRDKSIAGLDKLPNRLPETIHSWICAKLLGIELARRLAEPGEPFPPSIVGAYALRLRAAHIPAFAARFRP
jgi:hypothetical protein